MERPKDLGSIGMVDLLRMSRRLGNTAEKIEDEALGNGLRFEINFSSARAKLEMFLNNSTVRYESPKGKVELEGMSKPHVTSEAIVFQSLDPENERYLLISENGEAVVLLGKYSGLLEQSAVVPKSTPPKILLNSVELEIPTSEVR